MAEGHSSQQPGPYFYQEGGKTFASLPIEMLQGIQQSPHFEQMKKDCAAEGIELPKNIMANDPRAHILTPQQYLKNVEAGTMPPMKNHNILKELAEKVTGSGRSNVICNDGVQGFQMPKPTEDTGPTEPQVSDIVLQTDSCDTLYVNKDMLVAYTIAVVQNTQSNMSKCKSCYKRHKIKPP